MEIQKKLKTAQAMLRSRNRTVLVEPVWLCRYGSGSGFGSKQIFQK
jgi:hypothetical protein